MYNSPEYIFKYGSLIQFGVDWMQGFSVFADAFLNEYLKFYPILSTQGYSQGWVDWQKANESEIISLYDSANQAGIIPTHP